MHTHAKKLWSGNKIIGRIVSLPYFRTGKISTFTVLVFTLPVSNVILVYYLYGLIPRLFPHTSDRKLGRALEQSYYLYLAK